jgi:dimethylhistidine N-methyltransferase
MDKSIIENQALWASARAGLQATPKTMESKWFYDHAGSVLFEEITELAEYYPTRTEVSILSAHAKTLATYVPQGAALVELGSGASVKTRILLDEMGDLETYVPVDISAQFLLQSSAQLQQRYPALTIEPVVADFMRAIALPQKLEAQPKTMFFPGSTLGNLDAAAAVELLARMRQLSGAHAFIIGIDLVKDTKVLIDAYDDAKGVTAAFNLNLLTRMNAEIGADFDLETFGHEARWNAQEARIEMHLVSRIAQTVRVGSIEISFDEGESIHTENSRKYTPDSFSEIAARAGWAIDAFLTDPAQKFAVAVLVPAG